MDFDLSPDQLALRDAAREFLDDQCPPRRIRAAHESASGWDAELWAAMVDLGWLGVALPESDGGLGFGLVELAVLMEETGRHTNPTPWTQNAIAIAVAHRADDAELVSRLLTGAPACVVWSPRPGSLTAASDHRITGRSDPVAFASVATMAIVVAAEADGSGDGSRDGSGVFVVEIDADVRPARDSAMDLSRPLGRFDFDGVPARRIGGPELVEFLLDVAATAASIELLGASEVAMTLAVEYAKERVQFGRPIGSFQAVKHRCADMLVDVEGIRSSAYWAAWCLSVGDPDASIAASTAKIWATDASKRVMASALQVHGGIGFTWEHDLHLYMKRAQFDQVSFGDASFHRDRLGRALRVKVESGVSVL
ncbi:MAG: acyl-CoA/acyl-ACP dehydrogenase [Acidimicrobiia bacterium]|nr:acyl-CoA/acyl-ACP dehydrogenase [Acidimicrobiia bacterium]